MVIIIEGIDRVGKTTLCNKLHEATGYEVYKHFGDFDYSKMDNDNETDKMLQMLEIARIGKANIIFDRFHCSDFVYGTIERKYNRVKAIENLTKINEKLVQMNAIIIFMDPTDLDKSSKEHGKNLAKYQDAMTFCHYLSASRHMYVCNYNDMDMMVENMMFTEDVK
jgi:thymidylate kinase